MVWLTTVGWTEGARVKTGDLPGQDFAPWGKARQKAEPPYELGSGVTPVEQRGVGRQIDSNHD